MLTFTENMMYVCSEVL